MTRRPFIVVCPKTGRADVRTHKDDVIGSYFLGSFSREWHRNDGLYRKGLFPFQFINAGAAASALETAPPLPADAVWGPEEDEPKAKASSVPTLIASLRDIRIRLENGTIDELPQTIVVDVGDGRKVRYRKEGEPPNV